jgi:hypothetical protein
VSRATTEEAAAALGVSAATLRSAAARARKAGATPEQIGQTPATDGRSATWDLNTVRAWWATRPPKGWPRSGERPAR